MRFIRIPFQSKHVTKFFPIGPRKATSSFDLYLAYSVTAEEVRNVLKSLPSKTHLGIVGISSCLLREATCSPGVPVGPLVSLFIKIISLGCLPDESKTVLVIPVFTWTVDAKILFSPNVPMWKHDFSSFPIAFSVKIVWFDKFMAERIAPIFLGRRLSISFLLFPLFSIIYHNTQKKTTKSLFALEEKS